MKNMLFIILILLLTLSAMVIAQVEPGPEMFKNEDRYEKLMSFRIWKLINALNLDIKSEKGQAILDLVKKDSDLNRKLLLEKHDLIDELVRLSASKDADEEKIGTLAQLIDEGEKKLLQNRMRFIDDLSKILTPQERAKFILAEESFRGDLRRAMEMRGKRPNQGPGRRQPPR